MEPRILNSGKDLRLRAVNADEYASVAVPWYHDAEVLDLSEGGSKPYDEARVRRMFQATSRKGEVYIIELRDDDRWVAVGDAALLSDATAIIIGSEMHRSRGIGSRVLRLLIRRAKELSWATVWVSGVLARNERSLRMYKRAGFKEYDNEVDSRGEESIKMRLDLDELA